VCAVSYLNTVPLVWGMLRGQQQDVFDLRFELPAVCADQLREGSADIGLPPVAALLDQDLAIFRGAGIACRGAVRTILLVSRVPFDRIRALATDAGSRTSVLLSRIILEQRYGVAPALLSMPPDLDSMLDAADAALVIGDAALRLDPSALRDRGLQVADLGEEWLELTGLPMVFAVWSGDGRFRTPRLESAFIESARYGVKRIDEIADAEHASRGVSLETARDYLRHNLILELGREEYEGMERFLAMARRIGPHEFATAETPGGVGR
jgi:predicted solute-binding protein